LKDRTPTKPNRYAVYDDDHNFLRYEYHERADNPTEVGTPLSKANLLPDASVAAFSPDAPGTVGVALALLGRLNAGLGNEYVWEKYSGTTLVGYVNSSDYDAYPPAVSDGYTYTALGQVGNKVRVATGSFTKDLDHTNTEVPTGFAPKILFLGFLGYKGITYSSFGNYSGIVWGSGSTVGNGNTDYMLRNVQLLESGFSVEPYGAVGTCTFVAIG
jgi:hypothetical protein